MADPLGIIGLIGVATQIVQIGVNFGLDWKDAPADVKSFRSELQTLKSTLSEVHTNIILNQDFCDAFHGRHSTILSQFDPAFPTDTSQMLLACREVLDTLLADLKSRAQGHRIGWERLKSAFLTTRMRKAVEDLQRRSQMLNSMMAMDALALGSQIHKEVTESRQEQKEMHESQTQLSLVIRDGVECLNSQQADHQNSLVRGTVLDWLTSVDYALQQSDIFSRHEPGTGKYLLDSDEYKTWLRGTQKTLFCPGIPGAGKTVITSIMINDLIKKFHRDPSIGIAYLYCNYQREEEQGVGDLLANVLKQLAQKETALPDEVTTLYDQHKHTGTKASSGEIIKALKSIIASFSQAFIIVDALDECTTSANCRTRLLTELFTLQRQSKLNIFATSRNIPEITEKFKEASSLEIYARDEDVMRFLNSHASQFPRCATRSTELQMEIKTKIGRSVNGMFLLAQLFLDSLKGKKSPTRVREALDNLPTGHDAYEQAYKDAMERIKRQEPEETELAMQVLAWITHAHFPLSTVELEHAMATEPGERCFDQSNLCPVDDIISMCAGLVTVDKRSNVVRLVHYTTKQYFEKTRKIWFPDAETQITSTCMAYLSFDAFNKGSCHSKEEFAQRLESYPLYAYASSRWGFHARNAVSFDEKALEFLKCEAKAEACSQALQTRAFQGSYPLMTERRSGLHLLVYFCLPILCRRLLETNEVNVRDTRGRTPILYAVEHESVKIAEILLNNGADINMPDNFGITPLWKAVDLENVEFVRLLLQQERVDPNIKDYSRCRTPLWLAAQKGNEAITQLLLNSGKVDVDAKDSTWNRTPLSIAAGNFHVLIVRLLILTQKVDLNAKDGLGRTPLLWAASQDPFTILDSSGLTPIYAKPSLLNCMAVIHALLDSGANMESSDNRGLTALMLAGQHSTLHIFGLLIERGAELWATDESGRTAMTIAVGKHGGNFSDNLHSGMGSSGDVGLYLHRINQVLFGTINPPIQTSSLVEIRQRWFARLVEGGHIAMVQDSLASRKVDINWRDDANRSPLWYAYVGGQKEIARLLRSRGAVL